MRSADEDREISPQQLRHLMLSISDSIVNREANNQELTFEQLKGFREAWLNACLHNRWSRQTPPAVYMFDDCIEIISVGGLPDGLILEEFLKEKASQ